MATPTWEETTPVDITPTWENTQPAGGLKEIAGKGLDTYNRYIKPATPVGVLNIANNLINKGFNKAGQSTTEFLGKKQVNPIVSAGVGTAVSMAPDIAMSFVNPEGEALRPNPETIQNIGMKGLGYTKRFLKNEPMMNQGRSAVSTLLEAGKYPAGTAESQLEQLNEVLKENGQKIGQHLEKMGMSGNFFDVQKAVDDLNALRPQDKATGQMLTGGEWDAINSKIDNAIETVVGGRGSKKSSPIRSIRNSFTEAGVKDPITGEQTPAMGGGNTIVGGGQFDIKGTAGEKPIKTSWEDANNTKNKLQDIANYKSNKNVTLLDKVIAGVFRKNVDSQLEQTSSTIGNIQDHVDFLKAKKLYGAASNAIDPIYNKLSSELGNKGISLTDWILGSSQLAMGHPLTAIAAPVLKQMAERLLPQTATKLMYGLSKIPKSRFSAIPLGLRYLTRNKDNQ